MAAHHQIGETAQRFGRVDEHEGKVQGDNCGWLSRLVVIVGCILTGVLSVRFVGQLRGEEVSKMANSRFVRAWLLVSLGFAWGSLFVTMSGHSRASAQGGGAAPAPPTPPTMADVQHLKDITPPMSHPMVDVGFNATNLYFSAKKKNWPLANYYLGETRNRLHWETSLNPGPKGTDGNPVDMKSTFDGIDNGSLTKLKLAIAA